TRELTRSARTLEGTLPLSRLPRLASMLSDDAGELAWRARGEQRKRADGSVEEILHLSIDAEVRMDCVRCLGEAPVALGAERDFRLVGSEEQAAREDAEDDEYDVLAGGKRFDLGALIEDEAIMALPPLARHEACELPEDEARSGADGGPAGENGSDGRIRPFSELAALSKRKH
ncbi:MAG: YceD family protein, partial [Gammaproteobacteria bacterium]